MMTNEMIDAKIDELKALERQIKILTDQKDALKKELTDELDSRIEDTISTSCYNVFWKVYEKHQVDVTLLKKEGVYDKFAPLKVQTMFKITDVKAK